MVSIKQPTSVTRTSCSCVFTWNAKLILELSGLLKHLDAMVVGVRDHNVLVHSETEAVRRIELAFAGPELTKLAPRTYTHL